jgi:hypothetical protein
MLVPLKSTLETIPAAPAGIFFVEMATIFRSS